LLTLAATAWDRAAAAREVLQAEGLSYRTRLGEPRAHPMVAVERDAVIAFTPLIRELDLDITAPSSDVRPPRLRSTSGGV
jgi:phage terminase small subunit